MFRECYPPVRAYACRRAAPDAAQDVVADTFLVAWRRLEDVPEDALPRNVLAQAVAALTQENAVYHAELIARAHSSDMPAANQKIFFESWHTTDGRTHTKTYAA